MELELMTDRYSPITSQTRYPLHHAPIEILYLIRMQSDQNVRHEHGRRCISLLI